MQRFLILKQMAATALCSVDDTCGREYSLWASSSVSEAGKDIIYLSGCWNIISLTFEALLPT